MKRKGKTGPTVTRRGGKRMEVYVRPAEVVKRIETLCRETGQGRQAVLLTLIMKGLDEL